MSKIYDALQKASRGGEPQPQEPRPGPRQVPEPPEPGYVEALSSVEFGRELVQLRAGLDRLLGGMETRALVFAGAVPGEGASTIASRFAQLLATDPAHRVLLVDADLRNRDPRTVEPADQGDGFASLVRGGLALSEAVRSVNTGTLCVVPSEGVDEDPYRLGGDTEAARRLLRDARDSYHRVVIDAAPVLVAPETAILAGQADGVVLVVRSGTTKREVIEKSIEHLRKYDARVLGVVLNRQRYIIPSFIYKRL